MIIKKIKSFLKIPIEFPLIQYLKNYIKLYFINPVNLTREQFLNDLNSINLSILIN